MKSCSIHKIARSRKLTQRMSSGMRSLGKRSGYKFLETDSEAFIRDENCGKEEYPGNCSVIYPSPPCFDEYGDEEWYSWFIGGDRNLPGVTVENGGDAIASGGPMVVINGLTASGGSQSQSVAGFKV
ncbi:hypothetical protein HanXRQr2_Chr17g0809641 [Helianthus annuus]|nr:hypothetical protein HanXRQr2_Chr17g0809641 [Helianthus annuus]